MISSLPPATACAVAWAVAIAATALVAPGDIRIGVAALLGAALSAAAALAVRPAAVGLVACFALLGVARAEIPAADAGAQGRAAALAGHSVTLRGTVVDDPKLTAAGYEALVAADQPAGIGNVLVRVRGPGEVGAGDQVSAAGRLKLPTDLPAFDRRAYLAQSGAYLELDVTSLNLVQTGGGPRALPGWLRDRYREAIDQLLPPPHAAVLMGIVLGIRTGIPPSLQNDLISTGLVHLLVLSGLKVAVFARLVTAALNPVLGRWSALPAITLIALYALAGGATPAAVRASAMGGLTLLAGALGRPTHVWTSLALAAALMLGWRPELAWDVGFQLSFGGTAAIILLTPAIERRLRWVPRWLREPFAVTCAAQVGTLPMMAADFHVLSPVAPISNAAVLPLLPMLVGAGLLLAPLAALPDLGRVAALPVTAAVLYLEQVAWLLARVPAAAFSVPAFPAWAGAAYYAAVGGGLASMRARGGRRALALLLAAATPVVITGAELVAWTRPPPSAAVLAVGDGQAVLLRSPEGTVLIDGGPSPARLADAMGARLPPWTRRLDALVITGQGLRHVGGLQGAPYRARLVFLPAAGLSGTAWRNAALEQQAQGAALHAVNSTTIASAGGFRLEFLELGLRAVADSGRSLCAFGDLDLQAQADAAAELRGHCDYLVLPGGGVSAPAPELLAAARPRILVASVATGARLARGLPPAQLRRTDQEGTVELPM
ncbi:MAG TPA: ComEC/Rec2 family competence protein [Candidatus Dormibacteraeota bacterium]